MFKWLINLFNGFFKQPKEDPHLTQPLLQNTSTSIYDEIFEFLDQYPYDKTLTQFLRSL